MSKPTLPQIKTMIQQNYGGWNGCEDRAYVAKWAALDEATRTKLLSTLNEKENEHDTGNKPKRKRLQPDDASDSTAHSDNG